MNSPKISVLVAVYNAEKYLHECLDSLIGQTMSDIEVICIDDCSTDGSAHILDDYARRDARIRLLHNEHNEGPSRSRNHGLGIAQGEFITMLDSDDWLSPDALQKAYDAFSGQTDAVLFDLQMVNDTDGGRTIEPYATRYHAGDVVSGDEAFRLSINWQIHGLYVIRAHIHKDYPYDETSLLYSDDTTTLLHFLHSRQVGFCDGCYYYRQNPDSMTHSVNIRRFDRLESDLNVKHILQGADPQLAAGYETHRWLNIVGCYYYFRQHHDQFTADEQQTIHSRISAALSTVERQHIEARHKYKFGYYPFRNYKVFRFVEDTYFLLRRLIR